MGLHEHASSFYGCGGVCVWVCLFMYVCVCVCLCVCVCVCVCVALGVYHLLIRCHDNLHHFPNTLCIFVYVQNKSVSVPAGEVFIELGFRKLVRTYAHAQLQNNSNYFYLMRGRWDNPATANTVTDQCGPLSHPTITALLGLLAMIVDSDITAYPNWHGTDATIIVIDLEGIYTQLP